MKAFFPFLVIPAVMGFAMSAGPWLSARLLERPELVAVPDFVELPPNTRELLTIIDEEDPPVLRLAAIMPPGVVDRVLPPPPPATNPPASERFQLQSVLLAEGGRPSAVIDGELVFQGGRIGEYRLAKVAADHVVLAGPRGRERLDLAQAPVLAALPSAAGVKTAPAVPADDLERQYRRLLESFRH